MAASTTPISISPICTTTIGAASRATSRTSLRVGIRSAFPMSVEDVMQALYVPFRVEAFGELRHGVRIDGLVRKSAPGSYIVDGAGESVDVAILHEESGHTVFDRIGKSALPRGDDRHAAQDRFRRHESVRFRPCRRRHQGPRVVQAILNAAGGYVPGKVDIRLDTARAHELAKLVMHRAVANDPQSRRRMSADDGREGPNEHVHALLATESPEIQEGGIGARTAHVPRRRAAHGDRNAFALDT